MGASPPSPVRAILGPTNTGKTHFAIERMCAHSSGIMGFPLRLLAREVYDRIVGIKGPKEVGLITGEEKIMPPGARWLCCTTESMPIDMDVAFVALDEAQLGADPERGHVFTDRMLNVRGREETLILGSQSLRPLLADLMPEVKSETRPRFSQLSYAGARKLSRLPPRSAIIAFSAEEVYAIAELIRRTRGGAAIVMGGLSPRTRNAQVAMYQAGEVDFLVATDAIGMGLNMDIGHVAFASLMKFDGKRRRRLFTHELAQIAGRAGRHQRDGTFGTAAGTDPDHALTEAEIERIEEHRFTSLDTLYWRNGDLDFGSVDDLLASLDRLPVHVRLRLTPEATDHAVLKSVKADPAVMDLAHGDRAVRRLWDVCGLPDFRKTGPEFHARLVARLFNALATGKGRIADQTMASELSRLDDVQGDIQKLADRIAAIRTWTYAANRTDWVEDPAHWAGRARELEDRLSDALHKKLAERFVDQRTTRLMKTLRDNPDASAVLIEDGEVSVVGERVGRLEGFRFHPDPEARQKDRRSLLAAAEARMVPELAKRAAELAASGPRDFTLRLERGSAPAILWHGGVVATLTRGRSLLAPALELDAAVARLDPVPRAKVRERLAAWVEAHLAERLAPLHRLNAMAFAKDTPAPLRAFLAPVAESGGAILRREVASALDGLTPDLRAQSRRLGLVTGSLGVFHPQLLKPAATDLRLALLAVRAGEPMPPVPMPGLGLLDKPDVALGRAAAQAGYFAFGDQMLRFDLLERLALKLHDQRDGHKAFAPDPARASELGIGEATLSRILRALGFVPAGAESREWRWRGLSRDPVATTARPHRRRRRAKGAATA